MTAVMRKDWVRALSAHPPAKVKALAQQLTAGAEVALVRLPQAGLGLLSLVDGALGEPYYLGEFPLSACGVRVSFPSGEAGEGGAQVLADDAELARAMAILDAILAAKLPGWQRAAECVGDGELLNSEKDKRRRSMLAATRVDFSLLSNAEEDEDED